MLFSAHEKAAIWRLLLFIYSVYSANCDTAVTNLSRLFFFSYCCMRCVCLPQNQYLQIKNLGSFSAWQSRAFLLFIRIHFTTSLSHNNFFSLALLLFHAIRLYYFGVLKCLKHLLRLVCYSRIWSSFRIEHVILFPFATKIGPWWFLYFLLSPFHSILLCSLVVLLRFGVMLLLFVFLFCFCYYELPSFDLNRISIITRTPIFFSHLLIHSFVYFQFQLILAAFSCDSIHFDGMAFLYIFVCSLWYYYWWSHFYVYRTFVKT